MTPTPRYARVPARAHGGPIDEELRRLGLKGSEIADFSVNVNPYGPAAGMVEAVRSACIELYPDSTSGQARAALAELCGTSPDRVVVGNGAADLLWTLARVLLDAGETILMVEPTFSELRAAAHAGGARVTEWRAAEVRNFAIDVDDIAEAGRRSCAAVLYICTPNNPTGVNVRAEAIVRLAEKLPQTTVVVDQAFLSLSEHHADASVDMPDNVVRVRSITKEHAIPGVRVGYLIAARDLAAAIEATRPAWSTSAVAQAAAVASCGLASFVAESRRRMLADRDALSVELTALGLVPVRSAAPYCVFRVRDAGQLRGALLARHGVLVRDCSSFGLPEHVRVAARPTPDQTRLLRALREEIDRCSPAR